MNNPIIKITIAALIALTVVSDGLAHTRIRFARGRTSATTSGRVGGGGVRRYILGARAGQELSGNVSSTNGCVKFTDQGSTALTFTTESGDNWISVTNYCSRPTNFVLTVSINY